MWVWDTIFVSALLLLDVPEQYSGRETALVSLSL